MFSKQAAQGYDFVVEPPSIQDVVAETADVDDFTDQVNDLILILFFFAAIFLMLTVPIFAQSRYSPPDIPTPKRPPSL